MRENLSAARAAELLMQKDNITLLCHRRPDGDTVGSAFALYYALKELGKEVRVLCADALPKQYDYLYGDYTPSRVLDWPVEYVVTVDVATAGMLGGVFAVLGVLSPTLTLTLLAAAFFQKFRTSKVMSYIMKIVKPVCIGMVLGVLVGLCRQTCITEAGGISLPGIAIGILCFVLLQKFKLSVPKVIGIAAVLGLVCFGVF